MGWGGLCSFVEIFILLAFDRFSSVGAGEPPAGSGWDFRDPFTLCLPRQAGFSGTEEAPGEGSTWSFSSGKTASSAEIKKHKSMKVSTQTGTMSSDTARHQLRLVSGHGWLVPDYLGLPEEAQRCSLLLLSQPPANYGHSREG